jgi:hypothetical protein
MAFEKRARTKQLREPVPASTAVAVPDVRVAQIRQDCEKVEEPGEDVASLRDPGHGLHPKGVDGKDQRGEGRAECRRQTALRPGWRTGGAEETQRDEVEDDRIGGVQERVREMVPDRIHSPDEIVQA